MAALVWAFTILVLFGGTLTEGGTQSCTLDLQNQALQCASVMFNAFGNINMSAGNAFEPQYKLLELICENETIHDALFCFLDMVVICGDQIGISSETIAPFKVFDRSRLTKLCGNLPALKENLSCMQGLGTSASMLECVYPAVRNTESNLCTMVMANTVCAIRELRTQCPAVADLYYDIADIANAGMCPTAPCTLEYGDCGAKYLQGLPLEAVQRQAGDLSAIASGINYICGSGKPHVQCMLSDGATGCTGFKDMMASNGLFGNIQLEPAKYLLNYGCSQISTLTQKLPCIKQQLATSEFQTCFNQKMSMMTSLPQDTYDLVSCPVYKATMECVNTHLANECGEDVVDYLIKWSPAAFRLADGCGTWKEVSAAMTTHNIFASTLLLLSLVMFLFINN